MDGVLADFFGEVAQAHDVEYWREIHRKDLGIDQIAQEPGFFEMLPVLPNAGRLMKGVLHLAGKYSILSSPLLSNVEDSSKEKSEWLERHLKNHQPQAVIFDHEKYKFARQANGTPNILIDDYGTNIKLWEANGGIGIHYKDEDYKQALDRLSKALHGKITPKKLEISEDEELVDVTRKNAMYTSRQVLKYVQGIHNEYHMPDPILKHKVWLLKNVPVGNLKTPEYVHQDDPYRRVIDIDWDHVEGISPQDIKNRPVVADENGWVLDGNHRVTAARARGLETIPALVPYTK
jgi:5'(3')-deoxyribonucleotidase